jgi:hypothetical protein
MTFLFQLNGQVYSIGFFLSGLFKENKSDSNQNKHVVHKVHVYHSQKDI